MTDGPNADHQPAILQFIERRHACPALYENPIVVTTLRKHKPHKNDGRLPIPRPAAAAAAATVAPERSANEFACVSAEEWRSHASAAACIEPRPSHLVAPSVHYRFGACTNTVHHKYPASSRAAGVSYRRECNPVPPPGISVTV